MKHDVVVLLLFVSACASPARPPTSLAPVVFDGPATSLCPRQAAPGMPFQAIVRNVSGVVVAQGLVSHGSVQAVKVLSGPFVFYDSVTEAMKLYRCQDLPGEVLFTQTFEFNMGPVLTQPPPAQATVK